MNFHWDLRLAKWITTSSLVVNSNLTAEGAVVLAEERKGSILSGPLRNPQRTLRLTVALTATLSELLIERRTLVLVLLHSLLEYVMQFKHARHAKQRCRA